MTYDEALLRAKQVRDSQPEMLFHSQYLRQIIEALVNHIESCSSEQAVSNPAAATIK